MLLYKGYLNRISFSLYS